MSIRSLTLASLLLVAATSLGWTEDQPTTTTPAPEPQWAEFQAERFIELLRDVERFELSRLA